MQRGIAAPFYDCAEYFPLENVPPALRSFGLQHLVRRSAVGSNVTMQNHWSDLRVLHDIVSRLHEHAVEESSDLIYPR